ncbi:hypothetical protein [Caballeronia sp. M1242]|nr:hypothetical protein [Caballeronia sp. M1242]QSN62981.1 hypothetical protein JYK05_17755 [Caballeronia sp. M1242]
MTDHRHVGPALISAIDKAAAGMFTMTLHDRAGSADPFAPQREDGGASTA